MIVSLHPVLLLLLLHRSSSRETLTSPASPEREIRCSSMLQPAGGREVICSRLGLRVVPRAPSEPAFSLNLNHNPLRSLGHLAFRLWFPLRELLLQNTSLTSIHATAFQPLSLLRKLDLRSNHLVLPHALPVKALPTSLQYLDLSYNPLGRIPDAQFYRLAALEVLRLSGAQLRSVSAAAFIGLKSIRTLYLFNNQLNTLPANYTWRALRNMPKLATLLLGGSNRWRCDCTLRWLKLWQMENSRVNVTITMLTASGPKEYGPICTEPPEMRGRNLFDVSVPVMAFACSDPIAPRTGALSPRPVGATFVSVSNTNFVLYAAIGGAWVLALCSVVGIVCLRLGQANGSARASNADSGVPQLTSMGSNLPQLQACVTAMEEEEAKKERKESDVKEEPLPQQNNATDAVQPSISYV